MSSTIHLSHAGVVWPDGSVALDDVTGTFRAGSTGLVGRNGAGKTTLLRLVAGDLAPTSGTVTATGRAATLPQSLPTHPGTVADALGIARVRAAIAAIERGDVDPARFDAVGDRWGIDAEAVAALAATGLDGDEALLDRPMRSLSGGEAIRVGLAGIRLSGAPIALLDEPSNNLDADARADLIAAIRDWSGTLVVASHDRALLEHVDRIAEIHGRELRTFDGPWSTYEEAIAIEQAAARRRLHDAEALHRRERADRIDAHERRQRAEAAGRRRQAAGGIPRIVVHALQNQSEASTAASRRLHQGREASALAAIASAEEAVRDDRSIRVPMPETRVPEGTTVLELDAPDGRRTVRGPERIALAGRNGSGKSTLLHAIAAWPAAPDRVPVAEVVHRIGEVGMLAQRTELDDSATLVEVLRQANPHATPLQARAMLARFLFRGAEGERRAADLSGGERLRLSLARLLLADPAPRLLLLDEPTNDLDVDAIGHLVEALAGYEGAFVVVSHDERFLADVGVTRRWTIEGDGIRDRQEG
ncbi:MULTISPECIES: ATP-binding cassette domain-containing protein [unclassified Agrococcus]|uniref:ATP-binding cassette domain-containing protein n=1 Tax=unclassified Agrococcus TaxID=2615065 RepID=UPI003620672C